MPTINVTLDPNGNPAVTPTPTTEPVNTGDTITWQQIGSQDFTFVGVAFLRGQDKFVNQQITNGRLSVKDNNTAGDYKYVLMVEQNGSYYCSVGTSSSFGNGGSPTIHNN